MTKRTKQGARAIIYARLSPTPRGEEAKGGNLEDQVERCRAACDAEGWTVVETITEKDTSATSSKPRTGWQRVVSMVKAGEADVVIGRHYDRLYRKVADLEELVALAESTGVRLVAAESDGLGLDLTTATGRAQARYMAVGAALETEVKAERQRMGHQRRVEQGKPWWNSRPFGFEVIKDSKGKVVEIRHEEREAEALKAAYNDLLAGHSLFSIARRWTEDGLLTPKNNPWRSSNLRTMLMHPRNAGRHTYTPRKPGQTRAGEFGQKPETSGYEASWERIIAPEIFDAVVTLLSSPERNTHGGGKRKGLLTYIATCGKCDGRMGQGWNPAVRADGTRLRKYQCRECRGTSISADFLDDYVINQLVLKADKIVAAKLATGDGDAGLSSDEIAALKAEEVTLGRKKEELAEDYTDSLIDRETMRAGVRKADERLAEISAVLTDALVNKVSAERWSSDVEAMFDALDRMDDPTHHDELREIITDATVSIKVLPRGKGKRQPGPEDVDIKFIEGIE